MASISEMLEDAKSSIKQLEKKHKFKQANKDRQEAAALQYDLGQCRGKLESCKKQFSRTIHTQSINIADGRAAGIDTILQEQILWDAALGYLLVRDAIYALQSITSYDSVAHAYELLDAATKQMAGKQGGLSKFPRIGTTKERNAYGYVTSSAAVKQKEAFLDTFFEDLKENGDIEACLESAENPSHTKVNRERKVSSSSAAGRVGGSGTSSVDQMMSRLRGGNQVEEDEDIEVTVTTDIRPPQDET